MSCMACLQMDKLVICISFIVRFHIEKNKKNPKKIKNKNKKYHTVRAISKPNRTMLETGAKIDILKTYLDDRSFSWIGTVQGHQQKRRG